MESPSSHAVISGPHPSVLLVEDDPDAVWMVRRALAGAGIDLSHAETGAAALERVARDPPAVMLLDLRLPDLNGLEVLEKTLAGGAPTAVIVTTAHGGIEAAVAAMDAGATNFLAKPLVAKRLISTLEDALARQRRAGLLTERARAVPRFPGRRSGHADALPRHRERWPQSGPGVHHRRERGGQGSLRPGRP